MNRFAEEKIPFSVSVIDIDWHLRKIDPKYGNGWTGYTWNRKLFPDPPAFLEELHKRGMKVTLNVHPAEGVRAYEEMYTEMAQALDQDPQTEEPVVFDISNRTFMEAYFQYLHHPQEQDGVDFWWIDWQQGSISKIPGLDPLWMLNHFHYLDSGKNSRRPLTFSRYAGIGSHRYPIGFSGDTVISWKSLAFQPYNQYYFGELIVHPITTKCDPVVKAGHVKTWLPTGRWFDFFTGLCYQGGTYILMYRPLNEMPVLARAGTILPMERLEDVGSDTRLPEALEVHVFAEDSGKFILYEDDGETSAFESGCAARTTYDLMWTETPVLTIYPAEGDTTLLPEQRAYTFQIHGVSRNAVSEVNIGNAAVRFRQGFDPDKQVLTIKLGPINVVDMVVV